jgi:hypothetical protein
MDVSTQESAAIGKMDALMGVAPLGRVSQYWTRIGTAEAGALIRSYTVHMIRVIPPI